MQIEVLKSKLHCVKVTEANLNYMGSITIDEDLMDAVGLIAGETVFLGLHVLYNLGCLLLNGIAPSQSITVMPV